MNESDDDQQLFHDAVKDARPLKPDTRVHPATEKPRPVPLKRSPERHSALTDVLSDAYLPGHALESGEAMSYLGNGHAPDILRKLRRGHWVIRAELDLHGMVADTARARVAEFLNQAHERRQRCVRIIHGKGYGSRDREPVLKNRLRHWLMQREDVIAFAEARVVDGGSGAVLVLLKA